VQTDKYRHEKGIKGLKMTMHYSKKDLAMRT